MKKIALYILLFLFLMCGCGSHQASDTADKVALISSTLVSPQNDCFLCGENENALMTYYSTNAEFGIVDLHSFNVSGIEVNDIQRNIQQNTGIVTKQNNYGKDECSLYVSTYPARRSANICIHYGKNSFLDTDLLCTKICNSCLDKLTESVSDFSLQKAPCFLIDFKTDEYYYLSGDTNNFYIRDYFVHIDNENDLTQNIYILYNPEKA